MSAVLNAFLFRPPGDEAADCNSMRSSNDGTAILYAQHPHSEARYLLSRISGTTPAPRAVCFDKSTLAASIAPSAPSVAPLGLRAAPPTYKDTIKSNIKRALCKEDADTASLRGAAFPSSLLQTAGSRALIGSSIIIGLTRTLYRITKDRRADVLSEAVYSVSSSVSVKCISPIPQAAVSLTETLLFPSSIHYTDFHALAVVPPTGTTPLFYPPPPPESEPYNTGQTQ
ncbi:hypothetical protein AA0113_g2794 [Alternaria arborescens]|uniref:Uncharacterized protein n=1 Tax=Alternaria arborescens TaxID=156630 RepID=A0A4Q4SJK0_9PLEO|nr:hypothetical protein AA0113_g2794 [Alternaria arborescens]